jgi:heme-degrading monooxygenase HmoA
LFLTLWEFEVKSGCEELFEQAYGPEGQWVELFRRAAGYRGTRLSRELRRERVYWTLDEWETRAAYEPFLKNHASRYAEMDRNCARLTLREAHLCACELD